MHKTLHTYVSLHAACTASVGAALALSQYILLIALGCDWQSTIGLFVNVTSFSDKSCFWARMLAESMWGSADKRKWTGCCQNILESLPVFLATFAVFFFFASSCSTTGLMMKMQVFQGAPLVFHRGLRSSPPHGERWKWRPNAANRTALSVTSRCNFTVSKLNCLLIQILQILSMNITNRIRTKSQTWAEPKPKR